MRNDISPEELQKKLDEIYYANSRVGNQLNKNATNTNNNASSNLNNNNSSNNSKFNNDNLDGNNNLIKKSNQKSFIPKTSSKSKLYERVKNDEYIQSK